MKLGNIHRLGFVNVISSYWIETTQETRMRFIPFVPCQLDIIEYNVETSPIIMVSGQDVVVSNIVYESLKNG